MKNNILIFDSETTGLPPKGAKYDVDFNSFPHIVQLSWWMNNELKDYIIKPVGWEIPVEMSELHGITTEIALENGVPFQDVIKEFLTDCLKAESLVAHNIYFDSSIIKANILREGVNDIAYLTIVEPALNKDKRICTMMKTIKFVNAQYSNGRPGKFPSLKELYFKLFEEDFQAHNAAEDVKAVLRSLEKLVELKVIEI